MADGSIRIETKLDNSALKQQIKELERELKNIQKEQAKTEAQVSQTKSKYDAEREFDAQFPEEFSHRQDIDERAAKELDPLIAKQEELNQKEQQYLAMLDSAKAKLAEQANVMDASKQVDDAVKADTSMGKVQSQAQYNSLLDATAAKMAAIEAAAGRVAAQTGLTKDQILAANPAYQRLSDTMSMLKAKAADFGKEGQAAAKKTSKAMKDAEKSTKRVGAATRQGIAGFGRMGLALMAIRFAMRAISSATREYMAVNSELEGQINTLKALWGQVLGPVIQWVINLFIQAISVVNAFVQALTGINFIARANEAALKKQGAAAGGAAKAQNQLAGFDEQTKLSDTSGGGGGGGDPVALLDSAVDSMPAFVEKMIEQIKAGDWYGAGITAGEALMEAISSVDWHGVGYTIGEVLGNAVAFALGLVLSIDPAVLLESAMNIVTGLFNGISEAIQNVNWNDVGQRIVTMLLIAVAMQNPAVRLLTLMLSPGGAELTKSASGLVGSIVGALASAIVGMAQKIGDLAIDLWETIHNFFDENVDWEGSPGEIIQGLWDGITTALSNARKWIYDNIWVPFRDGFKGAFGIDTTKSARMKEFGTAMMEGLRDGIKGALSKVTQACKDIWSAIKNVFSVVGTWFKDTFTQAWTNVKNVFSTGGKIFDGIKEGIADTFKTIVNGLISGINRVIAVPFNAINRVLNTIRSISVLGISPFAGMWSYNPLSVPQIPKLALGGIVNRPGRGVPAIIGEAGAEAVLPLENHTEWMDILADKIGGGTVTIPITLDGKKIATYIVDIQKKKAFATNGA